MKPVLGTCEDSLQPHVQQPHCIDWKPLPKPPWWKQALSSLGNAIGESLFGGNR